MRAKQGVETTKHSDDEYAAVLDTLPSSWQYRETMLDEEHVNLRVRRAHSIPATVLLNPGTRVA